MGRREDRDAIQATWQVYEPEVRGRPITKADRDNALTPAERSEQRESMVQVPRVIRGLARRQRVQ